MFLTFCLFVIPLVSLIVPVFLCLLVASLVFFFGEDKPTKSLPTHTDDDKKSPSETTLTTQPKDSDQVAAVVDVEPKDAGTPMVNAQKMPVWRIMMMALGNL